MCVLFPPLLCGEMHYKSHAVAIPVIPAFLDFNVTVDCGLLKSITISVVPAAGK